MSVTASPPSASAPVSSARAGTMSRRSADVRLDASGAATSAKSTISSSRYRSGSGTSSLVKSSSVTAVGSNDSGPQVRPGGSRNRRSAAATTEGGASSASGHSSSVLTNRGMSNTRRVAAAFSSSMLGRTGGGGGATVASAGGGDGGAMLAVAFVVLVAFASCADVGRAEPSSASAVTRRASVRPRGRRRVAAVAIATRLSFSRGRAQNTARPPPTRRRVCGSPPSSAAKQKWAPPRSVQTKRCSIRPEPSSRSSGSVGESFGPNRDLRGRFAKVRVACRRT